ncbi:hypothetical protein KRX11_04015 [Pasteurellaceae bacterium TAE3-ERU1]|nr:hypothetical protein [Pasteurellaceae bacterium TAE3-ERU1]
MEQTEIKRYLDVVNDVISNNGVNLATVLGKIPDEYMANKPLYDERNDDDNTVISLLSDWGYSLLDYITDDEIYNSIDDVRLCLYEVDDDMNKKDNANFIEELEQLTKIAISLLN